MPLRTNVPTHSTQKIQSNIWTDHGILNIGSCRDIKGANLLVDVHGVVKLADFGMAKHVSVLKSRSDKWGSRDSFIKGFTILDGSRVHNYFLILEPTLSSVQVMQAKMNTDIGYDLAVDIWSLGCTIIEMFTGKQPWSGLEGVNVLFH
ncbi:hypothetical protein BHM03_00039970 [Ensete ventricosum]|uniref:Protein kinase domain-containing protein n=1 Tax=Ensete ventricosum TaxID=4639 RepID=A0A445MKA8_ENSVE|nr:hypothetical protein BHM03_00039970 [Ensete ventricosum]